MGLGWVRVGVKVVCIDGAPRHNGNYSALPVKGQIYTIASVEYCVWRKTEGIGVHLAEVRRSASYQDGKIYPYSIDRFKPLVTKTMEQDLEQFNHLLNPSPLERLDRLMEIMNEQ